MIEFYLMISLVVAAFIYMGNKALKTCDISYEIIDLTSEWTSWKAKYWNALS